MRALCSRWACTTPCNALRWRVDSPSHSTVSTTNSSSSDKPGVAASNSRYWLRKSANATSTGTPTQASTSRAAVTGLRRGVARSNKAPSSSSASASAPEAHAGRRSQVPSIRFSSNCAWISLPDMSWPIGVACKSCRPMAVGPISTICRRSRAGSTLPSSTSTAETKRSGRCGEKYTRTAPSASVGMSSSPTASRVTDLPDTLNCSDGAP